MPNIEKSICNLVENDEGLLPCPFCGDADVYLCGDNIYDGEIKIGCNGCDGTFSWDYTKKNTIEKWNNRK